MNKKHAVAYAKGAIPGVACSVSVQAKEPDEWLTGGAPMTRAQAGFLQKLCKATGEAFEPALSKADASRRIEALRDQARSAKAQAS